MSRSRVKCAACKERIPDHEPDLLLEDLDNEGRLRYFHTRCRDAAYAAVAEKPSFYRLSVRHVEEVAN